LTTETKTIELSNIWKKYSANDVLRGLNLTAKERDFISIRGKSGVGKSTLLFVKDSEGSRSKSTYFCVHL